MTRNTTQAMCKIIAPLLVIMLMLVGFPGTFPGSNIASAQPILVKPLPQIITGLTPEGNDPGLGADHTGNKSYTAPNSPVRYLVSENTATPSSGQEADAQPVQAEPTSKSSFPDVSTGNPDLLFVQYISQRKIMQGFPDGTFYPAEGLTRAQAAVVICKAAGLKTAGVEEDVFKDVPARHWAAGYIEAAVKAGYIKGFPDGSYQPEAKLTRAQGISLVMLLCTQKDTAELPALKDMNKTHWAAGPMAVALAAGMIGLSKDQSQVYPDAEMSRGNLARAVAILLTRDPVLSKVPLMGILKDIKGQITLTREGKSVDVKEGVSVVAGDAIKTGPQASADIVFPDGSSSLVNEDTQIVIKQSDGRSCLKQDGTPGTAVDLLYIDLKQGTVFGALATKHEADSQENKTGLQTDSKVAALNSFKLLAAGGDKQNPPWYKTAETKKVKVKVDMPWGIAAIRGTFIKVTVNQDGSCHVSCLTGSAEVSGSSANAVTLGQGQASGISEQGQAPAPVQNMTQGDKQEFAKVQEWVVNTALQQDLNQEAVTPPPAAEAVVETLQSQKPTQAAQVETAVKTVINALQTSGIQLNPQVIDNLKQQVNQLQTKIDQATVQQLNNTLSQAPSASTPISDSNISSINNSNITNSGSTTSDSPVVVVFNDTNLEAAVRQALGKAAGPITMTDMARLTSLSASKCGIEDLSGLQYGYNLTVLDLGYNKISDISKLTTLYKLQELYLPYNNIGDISTVNWLVLSKLNVLRLGNNPLSDISPLASAANLKELQVDATKISSILALPAGLTVLNISNTAITDLSFLSGLPALAGLAVYGDYGINSGANVAYMAAKTGLSWLDIGRTGINDAQLNTILSGMGNLQRLGAAENQITDVTPLQNKTALIGVVLNNNHISSLSPLSGLTNLDELHLDENPLTDSSLSPIWGLTNLTCLSFHNSNNSGSVTSIAGIENLANLAALDIGGNQISDIATLSGMTGMKNLAMFGNPITNVNSAVGVIAGMTDMEELHIDNLGTDAAKLSSLSALANMSHLQRLWVTGNQISDLVPLSGRTSLIELHLDENPLTDSSLSPIWGLTNLTCLSFHNSSNSGSVTSIAGIENLANLAALDIGGNQISDIATLSGMTGMKNLAVFGNPISSVDSALNVIAGMTGMEELHIDNLGTGGAKLSSLSALANMSHLQRLWVTGNQISDLVPLSGRTSLIELHLDENPLTDSSLSPIWGLTNLTALSFHNSSNSGSVTSIAGIENLANLAALDIGGNQISDIATLSGMTGMKNLAVFGNPITNVNSAIGVIAGMTGMEELHIDNLGTDGAKLSSLSALANMSHLQRLWATGNQISVLAPLSGRTSLDELHLDDNPLSDSSLSPIWGLTSLTCLSFHNSSNSGSVTSIAGIENLANLAALDIGGNQISDIAKLSGMTGMKNLAVFGNPISSVDSALNVIAGMTGMEELHIDNLGTGGAKLSSLSAVANMSHLQRLWATGNQISDLVPLSGRTSLIELHLDENPLTDSSLSTIWGLTNLASLSINNSDSMGSITSIAGSKDLVNLNGLDIGGNQISDISELGYLTNLKSLSMWGNPISDVNNAIGVIANMPRIEDLHIDNLGPSAAKLNTLAALSGLNRLVSLSVSGNAISDISYLSGKTGLVNLDLSYNNISTITGSNDLSGLTNLVSLSVEHNTITDISSLQFLNKLKGLNFGCNQVADISVLTSLNGLRNLGTHGNPITNVDNAITAITGMAGMEELHIDNIGTSGAMLTDLTPLSGMSGLVSLTASGNSISDISALAGKPALMALGLSNNQIVDISALADDLALHEIGLNTNLITDITPLVTNCQAGGLGEGDWVDIQNNPLNAQGSNIGTLTAQGVTVESN